MTKIGCCLPLLSTLAIFCTPDLSAWDRIGLEPSHDNTLYETAIDQNDQKIEVSNGSGSFLFAGRTGLDAGYKRRRALLRFDLASSLPHATTPTSIMPVTWNAWVMKSPNWLRTSMPLLFSFWN